MGILGVNLEWPDSDHFKGRRWTDRPAGRLAVILGWFPADDRSGKVVVGRLGFGGKGLSWWLVGLEKKMNSVGVHLASGLGAHSWCKLA